MNYVISILILVILAFLGYVADNEEYFGISILDTPINKKKKYYGMISRIVQNLNKNRFVIFDKNIDLDNQEKLVDVLNRIKELLNNLKEQEEIIENYLNIFDKTSDILYALDETTSNPLLMEKLIFDNESIERFVSKMETLEKELLKYQETMLNINYRKLTRFF